MNKNWMKLLSLLLVMCTILSFGAPFAYAENGETTTTDTEEEFVFPEFGDAYSLGEVLMGGMNLTEYALLVEKNEQKYLMASAKGGTLYVLKLGEYLQGGNGGGSFIEAAITHGINVPRGIVMDSEGVSYTIGDAGYVFCYDFYKNTTARINLPANDSRALAIDKDDNLYVGVGQKIVKIDLKDNNKQTVIYDSQEITVVAAMNVGTNGDLYMWGNKAGTPGQAIVYRMDTNGAIKATYTDTRADSGFYLSYIDGVLFGGDSASGTIAQTYDGETLQPIDLGIPGWIMGVVTNPTAEGKSYLQVNANGVFEYDLKTRSITRVDRLNAWNTNLRIRDPYIEVDFNGITGTCVATMAAGHGLPSVLSIEGHGFLEIEELVEETQSPAEIRSVGPAVAGLKTVHTKADALSSDPQQASVYVGAYLSAAVATYYPDAVDEEMRVDSQVFSNGHAQTDSLLVYKDKVYAGVYNGGYIVEYDPATDTETQMIPKGLKGQYEQIRIHGLAAGDDKLFFSTIPGDQKLGGCIGWIDLEKFHAGAPLEEYLYVERNVVNKQAIISIVYDEERNLLYGASSIAGGTNSASLTDQTEGKLLVYDVENKKVLGNFSVMSGRNPNSDMVFDLEGKDKEPEYIAGIAQDPQTGKLWGLVGRTIFSFEYNEKNNTMKVHEELAYGNNPKGEYPYGDSLQWFPRPFAFDGKGYFYIFLDFSGSMRRVNTENPSDNVLVTQSAASRKYTIGTDGNLYIGYGTELYRVALNRVDIVKGMIDGVEPSFGDQVKNTRKAYETLTDEEKAQISQEYVDGLAALEGAAKIFLQVQADKVINAIDEVGAVTVSSEAAIASAREKYKLLDEGAKELVSNYDELVKMEEAFKSISQKSSWGKLKSIPLNFSRLVNTNVGDTILQMTTFDHITGGIWEYALSNVGASAMKYNNIDHVQLNLTAGWIAFRIRISEPGLYTIVMDSRGGTTDTVKNGGLYIFDANGIKNDHMYDLVYNEVMLKSKTTQNFVSELDYSIKGVTEQGKWVCEQAGEYLIVLNNLNTNTGTYGRPISFTFTKRDANVDEDVERAKEKINEIGKVTKNSGEKIEEANTYYEHLTDAQKEQIYAPQLEAAKLAYDEIKKDQAEKDKKNAAAAAVVMAYINQIGTVTKDSGNIIKLARAEYDKLSKDAKEMVTNKDVLIAAEKAFEQFAPQGDDQQDNGMLTYVLIGAGALVVILVVILVIAKGKKKKASVVADDNADQQVEEVPAEETSETTEE